MKNKNAFVYNILNDDMKLKSIKTQIQGLLA
jgi:hypothetical protein